MSTGESFSTTNESQKQARPFDVWSMRANRRFSLRDIYQITHDATLTSRYFRNFRKTVGEKRTSRIMLAVTEVNGCAICAYGHAKFALDAGIDSNEVRNLLGGVTQGAPDRELAGIGFAQHYADTEGHPDEDAWDQLVQLYGREEALGVLGATRMMMWGNAVGIPLSSLRARLKGSPHPGSSVAYEMGTILGAWVVVPVAVIRALFSLARHQPPITFHRG
ncbi:hypothetical protein [Salinibacterium sp. NK8237]|uniref:hypothetical protein n=1 Tax=Salinibacterium sp. NK8237 TaxID=2792038 RepID=UPI0018CF4942|nr:hypothetical protein [Salinibacterium sp. NK8237]MBH0128938.1 hypothetical protein [Salinibacterium sp. NK8237]